MVILPLSPFACAVVTTMMFALTFFVGRFYGMKKVLECMKKEIEKYERNI
jgi:hypothetical protein